MFFRSALAVSVAVLLSACEVTSPTDPLVSTLPPGSVLPSGAACADQVWAAGQNAESRELNIPYNTMTGHRLPENFFSTPYANDVRSNTEIASRVDGDFTGSTDEILRWGACKWGIDADLVRAIAVNESWWRQRTRNHWTTNCPERYPPGSEDPDRPEECRRDYGIMQLNYDYFQAAWPGMEDSTAMNVDTMLAVLRACYEGYQWWLDKVAPADNPYRSGDIWGCVGRYRSGGWYDATAIQYISNVRAYLEARRWEDHDFIVYGQ